MGLYQAALEMLLETRDSKRGIPSVLERDDKIRILQDVAWHLSTSARVELPKTMVERVVANRLASMPQVRVPPDAVLDELLQRSGVLREPVPSRIDFVHRTVQEYLTAKQAADLGDMDLLIRYAHRDTWRETVIMAAGHANEPLRRELLSGVLARARADARRSRLLKLVAVACLETLPSVPEHLWTELDRCFDDLIPPRDEASARSLASAGEPVLRRLPDTVAGLSEAAALATVQAAWLINGPDALDVLARYATDTRLRVRQQLMSAWNYFDADEYAERVLAHSPGARMPMAITSPRQLEALGKIPRLTELNVGFADSSDFAFLLPHAKRMQDLRIESANPIDPSLLPPLPALRILNLDFSQISNIYFLANLPQLGHLILRNCDPVVDYSPIRLQTELETLRLDGCANLTDLAPISHLSKLRVLGLDNSHLTDDLDSIPEKFPALRRLYVNECDWVTQLRPLTALRLEFLFIDGCRNFGDFDTISSLNHLRVLSMDRTCIEDLEPLRSLSKLRTLWLAGCDQITDLRPLSSLPQLKTLVLEGAAPGLDLSPLATRKKLTVYIRSGQEVRGAEALGRRLKIQAF
jgi:Leucine-rich repeat (LRR) protein